MSKQEELALYDWISEHVMGWAWRKIDFTADKAAAMEVLEKCAQKCTVTIERSGGVGSWMVARLNLQGDGEYVEDFCKCEKSLPLAICQFAKQLFSKEGK